jgi:hypothetical protein
MGQMSNMSNGGWGESSEVGMDVDLGGWGRVSDPLPGMQMEMQQPAILPQQQQMQKQFGLPYGQQMDDKFGQGMVSYEQHQQQQLGFYGSAPLPTTMPK